MDRKTRWPANLFLTFVNLMALGALPVSLVSAAVWARANGLGLLNRVALPAALAIAATLLLRGFVSFGTHWLMHHVPPLLALPIASTTSTRSWT